MKTFYEYIVENDDPPTRIDNYGNKFWKNDIGELHRIGGPAIEYANGDKEWYFKDMLHRKDGPAVENTDGSRAWYENNELHRIGKPAVERDSDGYRAWYRNGLVHRDDGGPAEEDGKGTRTWYIENKIHRENGPAIEYSNGEKRWYLRNSSFSKRRYYLHMQQSIIDKIGKILARDFNFDKEDAWNNLETLVLADYLDREEGNYETADQIRSLVQYYK